MWITLKQLILSKKGKHSFPVNKNTHLNKIKISGVVLSSLYFIQVLNEQWCFLSFTQVVKYIGTPGFIYLSPIIL